MEKTTLYLDEHLKQAIQRTAQAQGTTQAAVIRAAIEAHVLVSPQRPRSIGLGNSGRGDLAERADELLDGMGESP